MNSPLIDIHTHHTPPRPEAIVCTTPESFSPIPGQAFSIGIHPWESRDFEQRFQTLEQQCLMPCVVAIGECGLDKLKGEPLFEQMLHFRSHIELSERLALPLIIHCVKAYDILCSLRKEMKPKQTWIVHGFRGKPSVAQMILNCGCGISFGSQFNKDSVACVPDNAIFAETDESDMTIQKIMTSIAEARGIPVNELEVIITRNTSEIFKFRKGK